MPLYEYQCQSCHYLTEVLQKFDDPPPTVCPECGKKKLIKIVSATGFQLTGSGWYATDFKDTKPPSATTEKTTETETKTTSESGATPAKVEEKTKDETK